MIEKDFIRTATFNDTGRPEHGLGQGRRVDDAGLDDIAGPRHFGRGCGGDYAIRHSPDHLVGVWIEAGDLIAVLDQAFGHL